MINALILINTVNFDTFQYDKCINFDNLPGNGLGGKQRVREGTSQPLLLLDYVELDPFNLIQAVLQVLFLPWIWCGQSRAQDSPTTSGLGFQKFLSRVMERSSSSFLCGKWRSSDIPGNAAPALCLSKGVFWYF